MADGPHIVITDCDLGDTDIEEELLISGLDARVTVARCKSEDDVIDAAGDADALLVQWAPITARVLEALPHLRAISRYGIGLDMIDLDAARTRGIEVANVPHYCTEEVASHAAALLLALWRRLPALDRSVRAGRWEPVPVMAGVKPLSSATLGLLGAGRIAQLTARPFTALGTRVVAYDPYATATPGVIELVGLDELADADLISLHAPLNAETRHLVDAAFLSRLKSHAVLVNTARGALVDTAALIDALRGERIAGAGLDVYETEPLPAHHELTSLERVLITPHAAWCSTDALPTLQRQAAENLLRLLAPSA
ncbi:D-3-phosphoglycerate dehydrogenase [Actinoplanes sp. SE50]|nr:D-3-phosphoglycerate dehydrogenase [Actinoplanes sp. SE50/110]ATO83452.1 D-3-phosphoglycerate dehydrogenase [Actinoplanes sp. SE50]SLM00859.1 D-3-phosphoglycerate dehydrogenase [Actinoplanes sp. SE50/110]